MMLLRHRMLALATSGLFSATVCAADYAALSRADAAAAVAKGATILHDYGAFAWVANSGHGAEAERVYAIDLGGRTFDPAVETAARSSAYGQGKALRLVQFDGPVKSAWLDSLAANGVTAVQYIPPFSYVVWADQASLVRAKSRSAALRFAGDFLPAYKTAMVKAGLANGEREWRVMLYRGAQLDAAALRSTGAVVGKPVAMDRRFDVVGVEADAVAIGALARLPGVYTIQPVPRDGGLRAELASQISANRLGADNLPVPGYLAWLATLGVNGDGVRVADVDGSVVGTHPDLAGRMLPCVGETCNGNPVDPDHGTHVAGIIAGDGSSGRVDAGGFLRGLGAAPRARLIDQRYEPFLSQPGGMLKLMRESHDNGADLSSNSWGPSASPLGYDMDTRQVDVGVRDTKPDAAGDQPMIYVLSIMNGDGGVSTQGSPDEAKNTITVGSTKGQTPTLAADPNFNDISANSGAGPALDGRRIPHLLAPGCRIDSTLPEGEYGLMCGTSMATPLVSGAAALFVEKFRDAHAGVSPSAALVKAALVAAAQDLEGNKDADGGMLGHRPDSRQGWGRLRTDWLLGATPTLYYDQNTRRFDGTGEEWFANVTQADPARPMQVVLVWTDAPGHGLGGTTPAWNNDLDLSATVGANTYKGNVFGAGGLSATGGTADERNNIEAVILDTAAVTATGGAITIRVAASNITSDALPNGGDDSDQDFALVCVNCVAQPDYTLAIPVTQQSVCTANATTAQYDVAVGAVLGYATPVSLALSGVPAGAAGAVSPASVTPPGNAVIALSGLAEAAPGAHTLQLQAASTSANRNWPLSLVVASATPAAPVLDAPANDATQVDPEPAFAWATSAQAADYVFELAADAGFANVVFSRTGNGTSLALEEPLAGRTQYWWRVRPSNACGAGSYSTVRTFRTRPTPADCPEGTTASPVSSNDFENGEGGWVAGEGEYQWSLGTARASSGTHAWLAVDPGATSDQTLTSPSLALPAGRSPLTLQFMSDQTLEDWSGGCWDGGLLEISADDGATFSPVPAAAMLTDPYDGVLGTDNPAAGLRAWCGDPQAWTRSVVNLDAWAGQSVRLRFRMASDSAVGREPHGWYVDDVKVQGCSVQQPDAIFADDFD